MEKTETEKLDRTLRTGNTWSCSCGNATDGDGFDTCTDMGYGWVVCEPTPTDWAGSHWMCMSCGSVFDVVDVFAVGTVQAIKEDAR